MLIKYQQHFHQNFLQVFSYSQAELTMPFHVFCCHYFPQGELKTENIYFKCNNVNKLQLHQKSAHRSQIIITNLCSNHKIRVETDVRKQSKKHSVNGRYYYLVHLPYDKNLMIKRFCPSKIQNLIKWKNQECTIDKQFLSKS